MKLSKKEIQWLLEHDSTKLANKGYALEEHFNNIYNDFFIDTDLKEKKILELGPGRCEMLTIFSKVGAQGFGIDKNTGVIKVGRNRKFKIFKGDLKKLKPSKPKYDGLFCRESINAFWLRDDAAHVMQIIAWNSYLRRDGWGWILPCNRLQKGINPKSERVQYRLDLQIKAFELMGFKCIHLTQSLADRYGQQKDVTNTVLFVKNLHTLGGSNGTIWKEC